MTQYRCGDGDVLDAVVARKYGRGIEALPAVLAANPHIRKHPPHLPVGTLITLPELPAPPAKQTIKLWD